MQYALAHKQHGDLVLIEKSAGFLYTFYHQTSGFTVDGNIYLVASGAKTMPCSPTRETDFLTKYRRVWIVYAPPGTFEPSYALGQYLKALAAAGSTNVAELYPDNTAVIVVNPHGRRSDATRLAPPTWQTGGTHVCLSFNFFTSRST
jgi:hypothetical protein